MTLQVSCLWSSHVAGKSPNYFWRFFPWENQRSFYGAESDYSSVTKWENPSDGIGKKEVEGCTGSNWEIRSEVVLNPAAFRVGVGYHGMAWRIQISPVHQVHIFCHSHSQCAEAVLCSRWGTGSCRWLWGQNCQGSEMIFGSSGWCPADFGRSDC